MAYQLIPADRHDAPTIAALHTDSWRSAYRGLVPDEFLAGPVVQNRLQFWTERMAHADAPARLVLLASSGTVAVGFTCVLRDADPAHGPLLDNLHVRPDHIGRGIGHQLFVASREWSARVAPGQPMHLWVIEDNLQARRFYDREGGTMVERQIVEVTAGIRVPAIRYQWDPS